MDFRACRRMESWCARAISNCSLKKIAEIRGVLQFSCGFIGLAVFLSNFLEMTGAVHNQAIHRVSFGESPSAIVNETFGFRARKHRSERDFA
jgi:hypothetical protein